MNLNTEFLESIPQLELEKISETAKRRAEFEEKIQNYQQKWLAETGQYHHALPNWAVEDIKK